MTEETHSEEQESIVVEVPILETFVQIGVKVEANVVILNLSTVLSHDNLYALDRSQAIGLGSELLKMGRSLPSVKQLEKVQRGFILPS